MERGAPMVQSQPQPDDNSPVEEAAFEVTTQGLVVEVVITPHEESERPTAQAVVAALERPRPSSWTRRSLLAS